MSEMIGPGMRQNPEWAAWVCADVHSMSMDELQKWAADKPPRYVPDAAADQTMIERVARAMRSHWYRYQIGGQLDGPLYVTLNGEQLAGPFDTMPEAEFGRDCVIARAAIEEMREPTEAMIGRGEVSCDADGLSSPIANSWRAMIDEAMR